MQVKEQKYLIFFQLKIFDIICLFFKSPVIKYILELVGMSLKNGHLIFQKPFDKQSSNQY